LVGHAATENIELEEVEERVKGFSDKLLMPDITVLLTVSEEEQFRRINYRNKGNNSPSDELVLKDTGFRNRVNRFYDRLAEKEGWYRIDTTEMSIWQVAKRIIDRMEAEKNSAFRYEEQRKQIWALF